MVLDDRQLATLNAAVDRIVPADQHPGAIAAGAVSYLMDGLAGDFRDMADAYCRFLDELDAAAVTESGGHFANLPADARDALLRQFEASEAHRAFFRRFVEQVQEGFYISPLAWEMIGWKVKG